MKEVLVELGVNAAFFPAEAGGTDLPEPMAFTANTALKSRMMYNQGWIDRNY